MDVSYTWNEIKQSRTATIMVVVSSFSCWSLSLVPVNSSRRSRNTFREVLPSDTNRHGFSGHKKKRSLEITLRHVTEISTGCLATALTLHVVVRSEAVF
jgi:hypothetical protein